MMQASTSTQAAFNQGIIWCFVKTPAVLLPHSSRLVGEIVARFGGIIAPYCGTLPLYASCQIFGFLCVAAAGATAMQSQRVPSKGSNQEGLGSNFNVQRNVEGDGFKFNFICNLRHHAIFCHSKDLPQICVYRRRLDHNLLKEWRNWKTSWSAK